MRARTSPVAGDRSARLERIVRLTVHALGASAASLVTDEGVCLVEHQGEPFGVAPPPADALDAMDADPLLVTDIGADPRVTGAAWARALPGVGGIALAGVRNALGLRVGVLAAMHAGPHAWTAAEAKALVDLAALAASRGADVADGFYHVFIANLAHELRTPLNAILGFAQMLQRDSRVTGDIREQVGIISNAGQHLLHVVNDVIDLSRLEAGRQELHPSNVDLMGLLSDLEAMFQLQINDKGLRFEITRSPHVPRWIVVDGGKLRQILVNLLGNAVKYTARGGVRVTLSVETKERSSLMLVEVADTGPGIPDDQREHLFRPFTSGHPRSPLSESSGLGLALSRTLARLMGGDVTLERSTPAGSVFRFSTPLTPPALAVVQQEGPPPRVIGLVGSAFVLVIDDDDVGRSWLRRLLQSIGFGVLDVRSGAEGLAAAARRRPDLVLLDLYIPGEDPCETTRAIRALGPVVVAYTATSSVPLRERVLATGIAGWLSKPCAEADLLAELRRHLDIEYLYGTPAPRPPKAASSTRQAIRPLPFDVAEAIRAAARIADYDRLLELITALPAECADIAGVLMPLARGYAYDQIEGVLGGVKATGTGP